MSARQGRRIVRRGITLEDGRDELHEAGIEPARHAIAWTGAAELPDPDVDLSSIRPTAKSPLVVAKWVSGPTG